MAGNASPIFAAKGQVGVGYIGAANTGSDLSSNALLVFTGEGTNGSILNEIRVKALPGVNTAATVFRVWINKNADASVTTNNAVLSEITIPAVTGSNVAATVDFVIPMPRGGLVVPANYKIYVTIGTFTTNGFQVTAIGGDY